MLSVFDRIAEAVHELLLITQKTRLDEGNHAVVLFQIVLERSTGKHHSPLSLYLNDTLIKTRLVALEHVTFVAYDKIRPWRQQALSHVIHELLGLYSLS